MVRTRTDPLTLLTSVRNAIWLIDKKLPLASVQTMQQVMDTEMARPRLTMFLLVLFGLAALALAAVGQEDVLRRFYGVSGSQPAPWDVSSVALRKGQLTSDKRALA